MRTRMRTGKREWREVEKRKRKEGKRIGVARGKEIGQRREEQIKKTPSVKSKSYPQQYHLLFFVFSPHTST